MFWKEINTIPKIPDLVLLTSGYFSLKDLSKLGKK